VLSFLIEGKNCITPLGKPPRFVVIPFSVVDSDSDEKIEERSSSKFAKNSLN
jgi:hypothetical protein